MAGRTFIDIVDAFPGGVNSGVEPLLIEKTQLGMAINISLRGGFAKTRPPIQKKSLIYPSPLLQQTVETGLFQGAGYYRPDYGTESLIAQISGHLIKFTETGSMWTVSDISIPGDLNNATTNQVWMWQSEKWMIVQDGTGALPIFFDGVSSRRSYGPSVLLGTTADPYTPPAIGSYVTLTLTSPYTGPFNIPVLLNGEYYQPSQTSGYYTATLTNLNDTPSGTIATGTQITISPSFIGTQFNGGYGVIDTRAGYVGLETVEVVIVKDDSLTSPNVGDTLTIDGLVDTYTVSTLSLVSGAWAMLVVGSALNDVGKTIAINSQVFRSTSSPTIVAGVLFDDFTVPAVNASGTVKLVGAYTGSSDQIVFIGGKRYTISPPANPAPSTQLIVLNLTDTDTASVLAGAKIMSVPELPAGRMGAYGMGRNWMCLTDGISYIAGDIVGGASGTAANNYRDSVLKTTENTFLSGGGTFRLPGTGDIITAMVFPPIMDTSLGQGPLQIFTAFSAFSNNSPVDRTTWESLTSPLQTESLKDNGALAQNSTILVNSDTFFRSPVGVGSLVLARRDFSYGSTWGNKPISNELNRILELDNQSLLSYGSAVSFDNRFFSTCAPNVSSQGIFHSGLITLNNDLISSLRTSVPSAWEGAWSGINTLQILAGRVNGTRRCFAFTYNITTSKNELNELLAEAAAEQAGIYKDNGETSIGSFFETAVLFNKDIKPMTDNIRLNNGEISLSDIQGEVDVKVMYRPLFFPCWIEWHSFTVCANTNVQNGQKQYRYRMGLGTPDGTKCDPVTNTPYREGLAFQFRVEITGSCTFQDLKVEAVEIPNPKYAPIVCESTEAVIAKCQPLVCVNEPDLNYYSTQGLPPQPLPPTPPPVFAYKNETVYFNNVCSTGSPTFTGTLPNWISVDADNNRLLGAAGTFGGVTQIGADNSAQSALNGFVAAQLSAGNLTCATLDCDGANTHNYAISGYYDGLIPNPISNPAGGLDVWDGTFKFKYIADEACYWAGWDSYPDGGSPNTEFSMDSNKVACATISYSAGVWTLVVVGDNHGSFETVWSGTKSGGSTPDGTYTNDGTGLDNTTPAMLTLNQTSGSVSNANQISCGGS